MSLFIKNGKIKSTTFMVAFSMSILYVFVFVLAYMLTADIVAANIPNETGGFFAVWLPPVFICLAASIVCCATIFMFKTKIIVPMALSFFAVYYLLFIFIMRSTFGGSAEELNALMYIVKLYMLPAVLCGNLLAWGSYLLFFRKKDRERRQVK